MRAGTVCGDGWREAGINPDREVPDWSIDIGINDVGTNLNNDGIAWYEADHID
ncbi:MAG TPA: hypothetical protein VEX43_09500 [Chthoniobacterales bacterium]|nr:hypothetical protein [Chthoniobacterales bacterium]